MAAEQLRAAAWRAYVQRDAPATWTAPTEPAQTKLAPATRSASRPLVFKLSLLTQQGSPGPLSLQDGDVPLKSTPTRTRDSSGVTAELTVSLPPGLRALLAATSEGRPLARPAIITLLE